MPLNINWQQILIHLFNFFLLYALLYFLLYTPVVKFMEERARKYKEMDDQANDKLEDAKRILSEHQEKLDTVDREIKDYKDKKFLEIAGQINEKIGHARSEEAKIIADAKSKAQLEYDKIIEKSNQDIKEMALQAAKKIIGDQDKNTVDQFIESTLKEERNGK